MEDKKGWLLNVSWLFSESMNPKIEIYEGDTCIGILTEAEKVFEGIINFNRDCILKIVDIEFEDRITLNCDIKRSNRGMSEKIVFHNNQVIITIPSRGEDETSFNDPPDNVRVGDNP